MEKNLECAPEFMNAPPQLAPTLKVHPDVAVMRQLPAFCFHLRVYPGKHKKISSFKHLTLN